MTVDTFRDEESHGSRLGEGGIRVDSRPAGPVAFLLRQDVLELDAAFCAAVTEGWERFYIEVPGLRLVQLSPGPLALAHRRFRPAHYLGGGACRNLDDVFVSREGDGDA